MIMKLKESKLRSSWGGGKRAKRVQFPRSQVKNVSQNRDLDQLCQMLLRAEN